MLYTIEATILFVAFCVGLVYLYRGLGTYRDRLDDASDYLQEGWPEDMEK